MQPKPIENNILLENRGGNGTMKTKIHNYFAAANSFDGFKSYFDKVFDPAKYKRIYILKGGPGTGKSSLMKKVMHELACDVDYVEAIHCSSDPNSLDGLILQNGDAKIAIIDGTAPHQIDPELPGCVDVIINLGDFWDEMKITERTEDIKRLTKAKNEAYSNAYSFLKLAGSATNLVDDIINNAYFSNHKIPHTHSCITAPTTHLVSSFNRGGCSHIEELNEEIKKVNKIVGIYGSEYIYMSELLWDFEAKNIPIITYPCVFDDRKIEYIFDTATGEAYMTANLCDTDSDSVIDASKQLNSDVISENRTRLEYLWQQREGYIWQAADELKKASENHFALEGIYSSSMDFDSLNGFIDELCKKIKKTLD